VRASRFTSSLHLAALHPPPHLSPAQRRRAPGAKDVEGIRVRASRLTNSLEPASYLKIHFFVGELLHLLGLLQARGIECKLRPCVLPVCPCTLHVR
jgi:hypothetical protein